MGKGEQKQQKTAPQRRIKEQNLKKKKEREKRKTEVWMGHVGLGICNIPLLQNMSLPEAPC